MHDRYNRRVNYLRLSITERDASYHQAGDCVMPREGIFARVLHGGTRRAGDTLEVCQTAK